MGEWGCAMWQRQKKVYILEIFSELIEKEQNNFFSDNFHLLFDFSNSKS